MKIKNREELIAKQEEYRASLNSQRKQILICAGTGCVAGGSLEIYAKMKDIIEGKGLKCALVLEKDPHGDSIGLKKSGCHGFCEMGPLLRIEPMGWLYIKVSLDDCEEIIEKSIIGDEVIDRLVYNRRIFRFTSSRLVLRLSTADILMRKVLLSIWLLAAIVPWQKLYLI